MKKETFTEKLIKRTYGISGPLDEYKRREADSKRSRSKTVDLGACSHNFSFHRQIIPPSLF